MGFWEPSRFYLVIGVFLYVLSTILYLPYYLFKAFGKGLWFKRKHFILLMHMTMLITEPKDYFKNIKGIQKQAVQESKELFN